MENDTRNTEFWIVSVEDGHYLTTATDTYVKDAAAGKINLGQDWFIEEDDVNRDEHLCTKPDNPTGWGDIETSYFACQEIHCEMRRIFNTDDYYDFDLLVSTDDTITIEIGKAKLFFNTDDL